MLTLSALQARRDRDPLAAGPAPPSSSPRWTQAAIVNAGDGKHEHPTQALLDVYTLRRRLGVARRREDLDRRRRRCTRASRARTSSPSSGWARRSRVAGPPTLIPRGDRGARLRGRATTLDELGEADVVYALRMQRERMERGVRALAARVRGRATRSTAAGLRRASC